MKRKNTPVSRQSKENYGSRIVSERARLKFKQVDLCIRAGITKTTQIKYEASEGKPGIDYLNTLDSLGFDILYIVTGDRTTGSQLSEQQQNLIDIWEAAPAQLRDAALAVLLSPYHKDLIQQERDTPGRYAYGALGEDNPRFQVFMQLYSRYRNATKDDKPITAARFEPNNTTQNLEAILGLLRNPDLNRVILFATHAEPSHGFSREDGPKTNLPLVAALVEIKPEGIPPLYVVFDGLFLTAARLPHYGEVRKLLDTAEASGKAFYCPQRVLFTSNCLPEEAARIMLNCDEQLPLDSVGRMRYFALLSNVPEASLK